MGQETKPAWRALVVGPVSVDRSWLGGAVHLVGHNVHLTC